MARTKRLPPVTWPVSGLNAICETKIAVKIAPRMK